MTIEEIYRVWFDHFTAVLEIASLEELDRTRWFGSNVVTYKCPCGGDHVAARFHYEEGYGTTLSPVLTCFVNNLQWLVKERSIADIIREEEETYIKLLGRSGKIVKKVTKQRGRSPETLHYLWDTHGIPNDIVEDIWSDLLVGSTEEMT